LSTAVKMMNQHDEAEEGRPSEVANVGLPSELPTTEPDLSKPAPHTLPHDQFLAKLKSFTNLRAVPDSNSSTGWKLETGPFPGWEKVPGW